jgi:hypothetical protein
MGSIERWHDLAVEIVDGIRGFSVEFASDPQRQRDEYEIVKGILAHRDPRGAVDRIAALERLVEAAPNYLGHWLDEASKVVQELEALRAVLSDCSAFPTPVARAQRAREMTQALIDRLGGAVGA